VLKGHTVDINKSGISAILTTEIEVGELVDLEFVLPLGTVYLLATVRERTAFRYGFQFLDVEPVRQVIRRSCEVLPPSDSHCSRRCLLPQTSSGSR